VLPSLPVNGLRNACVVVANGTIYVAGGKQVQPPASVIPDVAAKKKKQSTESKEVWQLLSGHQIWGALPTMKIAHTRAATCVIGSRWYVIGYQDGEAIASMECFDFNDEKWYSLASMATEHAQTQCVVWDQRIYVFGEFCC
jgi:hypothetical protein